MQPAFGTSLTAGFLRFSSVVWDRFKARLERNGDHRLVTRDVGFPIHVSEETLHLHDDSRRRITIAALHQAKMPAAHPSLVVICRLNSRPLSLRGYQHDVAAVNGLRHYIRLIAWLGKHVSHRNHDGLHVSREDARNAEDGEKRDLNAEQVTA